MGVKIGAAARCIRQAAGLTQAEVAAQIGCSRVHVARIELGTRWPSQSIQEAYRDLWRIDLYCVAWCLFGDVDRLPPGLRKPTRALAEAYQTTIDAIRTSRKQK